MLRGIEHLEVGRFRIRMRAIDAIPFSSFAGNDFRGGFGKHFRDTVCVTRARSCDACPHLPTCAYTRVYDPSLLEPTEQQRRHRDAPRAYLWNAFDTDAQRVQPGDTFAIVLTLIGTLIDHLDSFVTILRGMGLSRTHRFHVVDVTAHDGAEVMGENDDAVTELPPRWSPRRTDADDGRDERRTLDIDFVTPTMWKSRGKLARRIELRDLARTAASRISALIDIYADGEPELDFAALLAVAESARLVRCDARMDSRSRYSHSQRQRIPLDGFVGGVAFQSERSLAPLVPLFQAAEWTHLGRGTALGMGRIQVVDASP